MMQLQLKLPPPRPRRDWPWPFSLKPPHPTLGCEIGGITLAQAVSPGLF